MFKILDGRDHFYQWDIDRKLIVSDDNVTEVHFCNKTDDCSLVCEVYSADDMRLVNVPNILMQNDWRINVYAFDGNYTKHSQCFKVVRRSKPTDYIYTETEIKRYGDLEERIAALEEGNIDIDLDGYATQEYVDNAISNVELTPGPTGPKGEDGKDAPQEAVLYTPQELTEEQQAQALANLGLDELPTGGSDDVLLADFTLENDVTDFTVDSNDTETKFKALYFELSYYSCKTNLNGEDTKATHLWVCVNDAKCWLSNASTTANAEGCVYGWLNLTEFNSFGFVMGSANKANILNTGGSYVTRIISGTQPQQNFIQFRCFTQNGVNLIGAGTHLRVWGVNA